MTDETDKLVTTEPGVNYSTPKQYIGKKRRLTVEWPGMVTITGPRGYYPGCRMVRFQDESAPEGLSSEDILNLAEELGIAQPDSGTVVWPGAVDQVNCYFEHRSNLAFVDMAMTSSGYAISGLITRQLDGKELDDFQEASQELQALMDQRAAKRREEAAKEQAAAAEEASKEKAYLEVGKTAVENNLLGQLKTLKKEVADLKAQNKALTSGALKTVAP